MLWPHLDTKGVSRVAQSVRAYLVKENLLHSGHNEYRVRKATLPSALTSIAPTPHASLSKSAKAGWVEDAVKAFIETVLKETRNLEQENRELRNKLDAIYKAIGPH
jgi:hypothetical protein